MTTGIIGVATLLIVLGLSLVIIRLASIALALTGLSQETARFQARSAFTGTGFTTSESEKVVNHPVRRRLIMFLMIIRSVGVVSVLMSLVLSFADSSGEITRLYRLLGLVAGIAGLLLLTRVGVINRGLERLIGWGLNRWTDLKVRDYTEELRLPDHFAVARKQLDDADWLTGRAVGECELAAEGVTLLGIERNGGDIYLGVLQPQMQLRSGDTLILYGLSDILDELDKRTAGEAGDAAHKQAVELNTEYLQMQATKDRQLQAQQKEKAGKS